MRVTPRSKSIFVKREDNSAINYFIFDEICKMVAFRFIPEGKFKQDIIKNDKVLYPEYD